VTLYHSLRIDSVAQVITVGLLFGTGLVASLAGRARRRQTVPPDTQAGIIRLLNGITRLDAEGHVLDGRPPRGAGGAVGVPLPGAVLGLVRHRRPVGRLIVTFRQGEGMPPSIRLALATVAHALATTTGPAVSRDQ
jgi:hypothetical protein